MADVKLIRQGQPVLVPEEYLEQAISSGQFTMPPGEVKVQDPQGSFGTVPSDYIQKAMQQGYKLVTPSMELQENYGGPVEVLKTAGESLVKGVLGPLGESVLEGAGIDPIATASRAEANPGTAIAGEVAGLVSPVGEGALLAKAGTAAVRGLEAGLIKQAAKGAVETALYQTGEEVERYVKDPSTTAESAIANVGLAAALGGGAGGAFYAVPKGLAALGASKPAKETTKFIEDFRGRISEVANYNPQVPEVRPDWFMGTASDKAAHQLAKQGIPELAKAKTPGAKAADFLLSKGMDDLGATAGAGVGGALGGSMGAIMGKQLGGMMDEPLKKAVQLLAKPIMSKAVDGPAFITAKAYISAALKQEEALRRASIAIVTGRMVEPEKNEKQLAKLKERIEEAVVNPMKMLENERKLAHYLPEQEAALSTTMANAISYLSTLAPNTAPKAPLDMDRRVSAPQQTRYDNALQIAQNPQTVLYKVQQGTLTANDITDLNMLYPGLQKQMQEKLIAEVANLAATQKELPYKTKLSLSKFLGVPLETSISPMAVQFSMLPPPPQANPRPANMDKLMRQATISQTPSQARQADRLRQ